MARPMPREEPVIKATLPLSDDSNFVSSVIYVLSAISENNLIPASTICSLRFATSFLF